MTLSATTAVDFDRSDALDARVIADLRTDHAGETGAVWIYRGVLAIARNDDVRAFAAHHLETEQRHLTAIEDVLPNKDRSRLLPVWRIAGWLTGALPTLFGAKAVYHTIEAVETFVDQHYQEQIDMLEAAPRHAALRALLMECQADEVRHRDEAHSSAHGAPGPAMRVWTALVAAGSKAAVGAARLI